MKYTATLQPGSLIRWETRDDLYIEGRFDSEQTVKAGDVNLEMGDVFPGHTTYIIETCHQKDAPDTARPVFTVRARKQKVWVD